MVFIGLLYFGHLIQNAALSVLDLKNPNATLVGEMNYQQRVRNIYDPPIQQTDNLKFKLYIQIC